jgi:hypothetical protein
MGLLWRKARRSLNKKKLKCQPQTIDPLCVFSSGSSFLKVTGINFLSVCLLLSIDKHKIHNINIHLTIS